MCAKKKNPKKAVLAEGVVVEGLDLKLQKRASKKRKSRLAQITLDELEKEPIPMRRVFTLLEESKAESMAGAK